MYSYPKVASEAFNSMKIDIWSDSQMKFGQHGNSANISRETIFILSSFQKCAQ
jgi:hypothetical protein